MKELWFIFENVQHPLVIKKIITLHQVHIFFLDSLLSVQYYYYWTIGKKKKLDLIIPTHAVTIIPTVDIK